MLHYICHLLNMMGEKAYLYPGHCGLAKTNFLTSIFFRLSKRFPKKKEALWYFYQCLTGIKSNYKRNPQYKTPLISVWKAFFGRGLSNYIVLYGETIDFNPVGGKNVTRLLMHHPGHFTGRINYGTGELLFHYNHSFGRDFVPCKGSVMSPSYITVATRPEWFYPPSDEMKREGIAYCIRKGKGKPLIHDESNAVCIDDMPLSEVGELFRRVKMFVSYDPMTALSSYALLCHCPSVIVLGEGETPEGLRPVSNVRDELAYSIDDVEKHDWEKSYAVIEQIYSQKEAESIANVKTFIKETQEFFNGNK